MVSLLNVKHFKGTNIQGNKASLKSTKGNKKKILKGIESGEKSFSLVLKVADLVPSISNVKTGFKGVDTAGKQKQRSGPGGNLCRTGQADRRHRC